MSPTRNVLKHTKPIADVLTAIRAFLALCIAWLGVLHGPDALPYVTLAVIASWITDLLDGPLARRDPNSKQTWVGQHDAEADMATSVGLYLYLVFSGYIVAWLGIGLLVVMLGLATVYSYQLAWPFYALPYGMLIVFAFKTMPYLGWALLIYLVGVLLLRWRQVKDRYLPEFFAALGVCQLPRRPQD